MLRRHQIPPAPTPRKEMYIPALLCPHDEMSTGDEEEEGPGALGPASRPAWAWEKIASDAASDAPMPRNILKYIFLVHALCAEPCKRQLC